MTLNPREAKKKVADPACEQSDPLPQSKALSAASPFPAPSSASPFAIDFDASFATSQSFRSVSVEKASPAVEEPLIPEFGDGPVTPLDEFESLSNFDGQNSRYTRYDVCSAWQEIVRNSFSEDLGFFATSLNGSTLEHGDFAENPFRLTVVYRASLAWGYKQMMERDDYKKRLETILEDVLQTKVSITYKLLDPQPGEEIKNAGPVSPWESDLHSEPILDAFTKIFRAELIATRSLRRKDPEEQDPECVCQE
ncbi:MAG: hypothetical protein M0P13_08785 [Fibrobacteraceae bacterium]|nr:hypothetical protein [Fibrobacteraceae bacterium]